MKLPRTSGVLLHPTSLSGPDGVGTLGEEARRFLRRLAAAEQAWWQILPLHPPGHAGSPYSAPSAFALNPMLIDLAPLVDAGWLSSAQVQGFRAKMAALATQIYPIDAVDREKGELLHQAFNAWKSEADEQKLSQFQGFIEQSRFWLPDYALYSALKKKYNHQSWLDWPEALAQRQPEALSRVRGELSEQVEEVEFLQWLVSAQWDELRAYARERGIRFIGDIPIFVAMDSSDVWAHRELFQLDHTGRAREVSGVPPDYFSAHGQKWGNPLYDWEEIAAQDYSWWLERVRNALASVDLIRIDHFRAFQDYWAVPADADTAVNGRWRVGPKDTFFEAIAREFGEVPFIAEDLGMITEEVIELRRRQGLPGMKVLQFADFEDPQHIFLPQNYTENFVAYTGTHDNNTTRGWYDALDAAARHAVRVFLGASDQEVPRRMVEAVMRSRAALVVTPLQDIFGLDASARMNDPSGAHESWVWRMPASCLADSAQWQWLGRLTHETRRTIIGDQEA